MSNRKKGDQFAQRIGEYLAREGFLVNAEYPMEVGLNSRQKKTHRFDHGSEALLVECKCYDWTSGGNNPSAKISTLNEAMMYMYVARKSCRKMVFVSETGKKGVQNPETFAEYYVRLNGHFIPDDVEIWEFNSDELKAKRITT